MGDEVNVTEVGDESPKDIWIKQLEGSWQTDVSAKHKGRREILQ